MADAGEFITDAEILKMCGANASATVKVAGYFDLIIVRCEGIVNCATRYDWTTLGAAAINDTVEGLLAEATGCLAAIYGITYDMSGYVTRTEAENVINVLRDRYMLAISILRDLKTQTFIQKA